MLPATHHKTPPKAINFKARTRFTLGEALFLAYQSGGTSLDRYHTTIHLAAGENQTEASAKELGQIAQAAGFPLFRNPYNRPPERQLFEAFELGWNTERKRSEGRKNTNDKPEEKKSVQPKQTKNGEPGPCPSLAEALLLICTGESKNPECTDALMRLAATENQTDASAEELGHIAQAAGYPKAKNPYDVQTERPLFEAFNLGWEIEQLQSERKMKTIDEPKQKKSTKSKTAQNAEPKQKKTGKPKPKAAKTSRRKRSK